MSCGIPFPVVELMCLLFVALLKKLPPTVVSQYIAVEVTAKHAECCFWYIADQYTAVNYLCVAM